MLRGVSNIPILFGNPLSVPVAVHWKLEEGSGNRLPSAGSSVFTAAGGPLPGNATGKIGSAVSIASGGRLTTPDAANLRLRLGFSVSFWAYPTTSAASVPLGKDRSAGREWIFYQQSNQLFFAVFNTVGGFVQPIASGWTANTWHHAVGTVDSGGAVRIYIDGVLAAGPTSLSGTPATTTTELWLGNRQENDLPWAGQIDELSIIHGTLTQTDVTTLYNNGAGIALY